MNTQFVQSRIIRLMNALMLTLFLSTGLIAPVHAQSAAPVQGKDVRLFMQSEGTLAVQQSLFLPSVVASGSSGEAPVTPIYYNNGPVHFNRVDDEVRGEILANAQAQCLNKVYSPVSDDNGYLRMIGMSVSGNDLASLPENGDDYIGGVIKDIEITRLRGCNFTVTAVSTQNDLLKLISWFSGPDGFERMHDTGDHGMLITEVKIADFGHPTNNDPAAAVIVTAARNAQGYLVMNTWSHNPDSGFSAIDVEIDEQASNIAMVAVAPAAGDEDYYLGRVITAFRTPGGNLRLIMWAVDVFGSLHRFADSGNQAGAVQDIAMASYAADRVVTAVKNGDGNLQLIPWKLVGDDEINRQQGEDDPTFNDPYAGQVQEIAITSFDFNYAGFDHVATAVRTEDGNLRLIAWGIDSYGNVKRHGDSENLAGAASHIEAGWSPESNRIVTTMRDSDGNLRAIAWTAQ